MIEQVADAIVSQSYDPGDEVDAVGGQGQSLVGMIERQAGGLFLIGFAGCTMINAINCYPLALAERNTLVSNPSQSSQDIQIGNPNEHISIVKRWRTEEITSNQHPRQVCLAGGLSRRFEKSLRCFTRQQQVVSPQSKFPSLTGFV